MAYRILSSQRERVLYDINLKREQQRQQIENLRHKKSSSSHKKRGFNWAFWKILRLFTILIGIFLLCIVVIIKFLKEFVQNIFSKIGRMIKFRPRKQVTILN